MEIIRELNKKSLIYYYSIYTIDIWSMLVINSSTITIDISCFTGNCLIDNR